MTKQCYLCKFPTTLVYEKKKIQVGEEVVETEVYFYRCSNPDCNEEAFAPGQLNFAQEKAKRIVE